MDFEKELRSLLDLSDKVRETQDAYFKGRTQTLLTASRRIERLFDSERKRIRKLLPPKRETGTEVKQLELA